MSPQVTQFTNTFSLRANGKILSLESPVVMGIINLSENSFYDGGQLKSVADCLKLAQKHIEDGAHILDIGAVSTKPNAPEVSEEKELDLLLPVLKELRKEFPNVFISADTFRSQVAKAVAKEGADIINDISGGTMDGQMFEAVAQTKLPYVLMHIQGTPQTMQQNPHYTNVVKEVYDFLYQQIAKAQQAGIQQIIADVGFGFGKTVEHNYALLKHLEEFKTLQVPLLVGVSRKSMINKVIGTTPQTALNGTTVLHTLALLNGAHILRAHDVKEAVEAIRLVNCYKSI